MAKVGILGAGSWGIALSVLLHNNGHDKIGRASCRERVCQYV